MKLAIAGLIVIALTGLTIPAAAQDLQTTFSGIRWGAPAEEARGLTPARQSGDESYFRKADDFYSLGGVNCDKVIYGFYQNQFFGVFMQVDNQKDFQAVLKHLTQRYGDARSQMRMDRTIYIWDYLDVKIKLKHYEDQPKSKLAFYYAPLAAKVNEARQAAKSEVVIKLDAGDETPDLDF